MRYHTVTLLSSLIVSLTAACSGIEDAQAPPADVLDAPLGPSATYGEPPPSQRQCAYTWLRAYNVCFADAGVTPETPSEEAVAAVARCWARDAKQAFDACCAARFDESCENDGMDWPPAPGAGSCAPALFDTNDACLADIGLQFGDPEWTDEQFNALAYCWQSTAAAAADRCCAAAPIRCDTDDIQENDCDQTAWSPDDSCATALFTASDECLAEAEVSKCDWRPEALSVQTKCRQVGLSAKAACCAERPDWACN
jgi:hypothetical protein